MNAQLGPKLAPIIGTPCPSCRTRYWHTASMAGRQTRCLKCNTLLTLANPKQRK
jgi:PHP family Zn ribbon phosphoesterase